MEKNRIISKSAEETLKIGETLGKTLPNGSVVIFYGELGAGKTTLIRGVAKGLEIKEIVQSPTFNIMKIYKSGNRPLIHIDAYRLADINTDIGLDEYIGYENGLTMIEWPMFVERLLPKSCVVIRINFLSNDEREIIIEAENNKALGVF